MLGRWDQADLAVVRELLPPDTGNLGWRVGLIGASRVGRRVAALP